MPARARPTSPHLSIYRWEISMALSILHRITGGFLALGLVALAYWWMALASGPNAFAAAARLLGSPVGLLVLFGFSFAFWFHLLNGIRHLFWDAGRGFERTERHASGWFAVGGALLLTVGLWLVVKGHLS